MLRLSKKMFYAFEAVLYIAYNGGADPISSRDIAERQSLPPRYLEQIMQQLVRAGILRGVRGPKGGYVLARERRRVTLAEICTVIREMDPVESGQFTQTPLGREIAFPLYEQLEATLSETLANMDMAVLCDQARDKGIARNQDDTADYMI